jgi:hypothetical protein
MQMAFGIAYSLVIGLGSCLILRWIGLSVNGGEAAGIGVLSFLIGSVISALHGTNDLAG